MFELNNLKKDVPAGIVVFLIALPLCIGVALASGAPPISGIISGVIGGIVVGAFSKSPVSVSGPAAGLAAIVASVIAGLGSFELFLSALLLAGFIQIILGYAQAGFIANYFPNNLIKGLVVAIGIILMLKQIPHALGLDSNYQEDFAFFQKDGENTFTELLKAIQFLSPGALIISAVSLSVLIFWPKVSTVRKIDFFPVSLFVILLGVLLNAFFGAFVPNLTVQAEHLVQIPTLNLDNFGSYFHLPSPGDFVNFRVWQAALMLAVVASLESLLNIKAIDKIDPHKRETPQNHELVAQGLGNMLAGIFGGIPMTSVIVRSSLNIQSDNATKMSTIFQGIFMLVSVLLLGGVINMIPLASIAVILIFTGYRLVDVSLFREMYKKGWQQFLPFISTIVAIVFTDLLSGVLIGLSVSVFYLLRSNFKNPFTLEENKIHIGEVVKLELPNQVSFFNKASIMDTLWSIPPQSKVLIDATASDYIDDDVLEIINDYKNVVAPERNIQLNVLGLKERYQLNDHIQFINVLDKETQANLKPAQVLELLKLGNERFRNGKWTDKYLLHQVNATAMGQNPMAVLVGCIDSRTSPELLFDAGLGDLLTIRIAGNIINPEIIGSIEISVKKLGAKLIVVKGHSNCGAVALSLANVMDENMHTVTSKIQKVAVSCGCYPKPANANDAELMERVTRENAVNSVREILEQSPYLRQRIEQKEIGIIHAYHDLVTGEVLFGELR